MKLGLFPKYVVEGGVYIESRIDVSRMFDGSFCNRTIFLEFDLTVTEGFFSHFSFSTFKNWSAWELEYQLGTHRRLKRFENVRFNQESVIGCDVQSEQIDISLRFHGFESVHWLPSVLAFLLFSSNQILLTLRPNGLICIKWSV